MLGRIVVEKAYFFMNKQCIFFVIHFACSCIDEDCDLRLWIFDFYTSEDKVTGEMKLICRHVLALGILCELWLFDYCVRFINEKLLWRLLFWLYVVLSVSVLVWHWNCLLHYIDCVLFLLFCHSVWVSNLCVLNYSQVFELWTLLLSLPLQAQTSLLNYLFYLFFLVGVADMCSLELYWKNIIRGQNLEKLCCMQILSLISFYYSLRMFHWIVLRRLRRNIFL